MTLKTKISGGLGFLFLIILTLAVFCSYYVEKLGQESDNILKDNYYSIVYSRICFLLLMIWKLPLAAPYIMQVMQEECQTITWSFLNQEENVFETNLKAENNNITEIQRKSMSRHLTMTMRCIRSSVFKLTADRVDVHCIRMTFWPPAKNWSNLSMAFLM